MSFPAAIGRSLKEVWMRRALRQCTSVGAGILLDGAPAVKNLGVLRLGERVRISSFPIQSHLEAARGASLCVDDDVHIGHGAAIAAYASVSIGEGARIGPFAIIMDTDFHVLGDTAPEHATARVTIGRRVQLGSHVTVLRGATIGDDARVRSGSVVSGPIPPGAVAYGVPARLEQCAVSRTAGHDVRSELPRVIMRALGLLSLPSEVDGPENLPQWDSLGTLKILLAVEDAFEVVLDTDEMLQVSSIADIAARIEESRPAVKSTRKSVKRSSSFFVPKQPASAPLFVPDPADVVRCQLSEFQQRLEKREGVVFESADELHAYSVREFRHFWDEFVQFSNLAIEGDRTVVCTSDDCEHAVFFPHAKLNFARCLLRGVREHDDESFAVIACNELGEVRRLTRGQLRRRVLGVAAGLKARGVSSGDRVVAIAASDEEAVIAALASAALGATWSSVSPELGAETIAARFEQLAPSVLFYRTYYLDHGKVVAIDDRVSRVLSALPSVRLAVVIGAHEGSLTVARPDLAYVSLKSLYDGHRSEEHTLEQLESFPFNHPLYVLFSSGTTGRPKCIVHGAGGTLLQQHKEHVLHLDLRPYDKLYFHCTLAWVMWSWQLSALATGAAIVVYEGSISYPRADSLWELVAKERVTVFGTSPAFLQFTATVGVSPREICDLTHLRAVLSTGSILPDTAFEWVTDHVAHVPVQSISGGTDIASCFLLGHPYLPVYAGELQAKGLGIDVRPLGATTEHPVGELVCGTPFPSRPLGLYGDADGRRFHEAYFSQNPGFWTHGDLFEWTKRGTGRIHGRSDSVMNIRGIRIGPAEIYAALAPIEAIVESMAIEQRAADEPGGSRLILLVRLREPEALSDGLSVLIRQALLTQCSRVHVPALILQVPQLPVTMNGKSAERAARDAVNGDEVGGRSALRNPEAIEEIRNALRMAHAAESLTESTYDSLPEPATSAT